MAPGESGGYLLRLPGEQDFKPMVGAHIPVPPKAEAIVRTGGVVAHVAGDLADNLTAGCSNRQTGRR